MIDQLVQVNQSQQLRVSTHLKQSLSILKMSNPELEELLNTTAQTNPFINNVTNYSNYSNSSCSNILDAVEHQKSIYEVINEQIHHNFLSDAEKKIAFYITSLMDENGYMKASIDHISHNIQIAKMEVERILTIMRSFEPSGIFSNSISQCIYMQINDLGLMTGEIKDVIMLMDQTDFSWGKVRKTFSFSEETIKNVIKIIKKTTPYPAKKYISINNKNTPIDAIIIVNPDNSISVEIMQYYCQNTILNHEYFEKLMQSINNRHDKKYCTTQWKEALFISKAIEKRNKTISKVLQYIIMKQRQYFLYGINYLKPMNLSEISKSIGLHQSTISRVSDRVIETPFGIKKIKFFFSSEIKSTIFEDSISSTSIQNKIKNIILSENKPLSDNQIMDIINEHGMIISRRTISKYRKIMNIPPSHLRRA